MDIKSLPDNKLRELILTPDHLGVKIKEEALDELLKRSFESAIPTADCHCDEDDQNR